MASAGRHGLRAASREGVGDLLQTIDECRRDATLRLDPTRRAQMGQFLTQGSVAAFMAGLFECPGAEIRILDPGAGTGSLSAALVLALCQRPFRPNAIELTAYEVDPLLARYLGEMVDRCRAVCEEHGISFKARLATEDFLEAASAALTGSLFSAGEPERFDCAILNPPYRKIRSESRERALLRAAGLETTNLYTGFVALAARLLRPGGELVAITPRSFCNGTYYEPFRRYFLLDMRFRRVHVFDARDKAFADDDVLQENVVFHAVRSTEACPQTVVSASAGPEDPGLRQRRIGHDELIHPGDRHAVIHVVPEEDGASTRDRLAGLRGTLADLGLTVSTGRVVDFRARDLLRREPARDTVPLIYPCHLMHGFVDWPNSGTRKPNALVLGSRAEDLVVPRGHYVLTRRFSAKEERRRIVAAVYDPARVRARHVAFENHLNYFHAHGGGLPAALAKGLAAYLNSSLVDAYFRQFSGHTQVNASDLRALPYPARTALAALGRRIGKRFPDQAALDRLVDEVLFGK